MFQKFEIVFHHMIKSLTENKLQLKTQDSKKLRLHIWSKLVL